MFPEDVFQLSQLSSQTVALLHQLHVLLLQLAHLGVQLSDPLQLSHPEGILISAQLSFSNYYFGVIFFLSLLSHSLT